MPDSSNTLAILETLTRHAKQMKAAYYAGTPGVTYDDMARAAERLLTMRGIYEGQKGRKITSKPTTAQVATLLRGNL